METLTQPHVPFQGSVGPKGFTTKELDQPLSLFYAMFPDELVELIVTESNRYADQQVSKFNLFII